LNKVLLSTNDRLKSKNFIKWEKTNSLFKAVDYTEKYGKKAKKSQSLSKILKIYSKFIKSEGLNTKNLELYLIENLHLQDFLYLKK
jgi:hypothetical protein